MASMQRARRAFVVGAFVVAAAAAPAYAVLSTPDAAAPEAGGRCLAWLGSMVDGQCISYSNGGGLGQVAGGLPPVAVGSPNSGNPGLSTGPLFPGQTINIPLNPAG
jgi:hypothetical protein